MKKIKRNKNKIKKIVLLVLLLIITVGFALLTAVVNINGITGFKGQKWKVIWDNVEVSNGSVNGTYTLSDQKTSLSINAALEGLGEFYEITVDAVNEGDLNAMIDVVDISFYKSVDGIDQEIDVPDYIEYSFTYADGKEIRKTDILSKHTSIKYKLRIAIKDEVDSLEELPKGINLKGVFNVNYVKTDLHPSATLITGIEFNSKLKSIANDTEITQVITDEGSWDIEGYDDYTVTAIKRADTLKSGLTDNNLISTPDSPYPVYAWIDYPDGCHSAATIYIYTETDRIKLNPDSAAMFYGFYYLTSIDILDDFDTSYVTDMHLMFYNSGLSSLDLSSFDTSNVTNMKAMFKYCSVLEELNISSFDTSKVINMDSMFSDCDMLEELDLSNFDTSNVVNMEDMFFYCRQLETIYVSNTWDVSNTTKSIGMFYGCNNLVGGNGTTYDDSHSDKEYARIDTANNPGYLTGKS